MIQVSMTVNGIQESHAVSPRTLLVNYLRDHCGLTGSNIGCDTTQCGCCTIHMDGRAVKSCTLLAVQAEGTDIVTIEGLGHPGALHPLQAAFRKHHALQCGYCTTGMVMSAVDLCNHHPKADAGQIRELLEGNFCRCTGYQNIVKAVQQGQAAMAHS